MRYKEIECDYASSYGDTVLRTEHKSLERSVASLYTKSVFMLFRPMLQRACRCNIEKRVKRCPIFTYIVTKYPRQDIHWQVSYDEEKLTFGCSCKRLETLGIACEHIIVVLIKLNIVVMPNSLILTRWTKDVKDLLNAANANSSSQRDPAFVTTYVTLVE